LLTANLFSPEGVTVCYSTAVWFEFRPGYYSELDLMVRDKKT